MSVMSRLSLLMRKIGCTTIFDSSDLSSKLCTVLLLESSSVLSVSDGDTGGVCDVLVGFSPVRSSSLNKAQRSLFLKLGVECKKKILQFKVVKEEAVKLSPKQELSVDYFGLGQYVDVTGQSIGKGFSGVMKRHNFSGLSASHGVSISHRSQGSTGQCQDPGRVFKGKKMAGRLGGSRVTTHNLRVVDVDPQKQLLVVSGSVPGCKGGYVLLRDAIKKPFLVKDDE